MLVRFISLLLVLFLMSPAAFAQSQTTDIRPEASRVTGEALLGAFQGITHEGAYNFTREGAATKFYTETHHDNGSTSYVEGDLKSDGVWIILQDSLCFEYKNNAMQGGCFRVYQVENCYYYYSRNIPQRPDELDRDYWTARSVKQGDEPRCDAVFM